MCTRISWSCNEEGLGQGRCWKFSEWIKVQLCFPEIWWFFCSLRNGDNHHDILLCDEVNCVGVWSSENFLKCKVCNEMCSMKPLNLCYHDSIHETVICFMKSVGDTRASLLIFWSIHAVDWSQIGQFVICNIFLMNLTAVFPCIYLWNGRQN